MSIAAILQLALASTDAKERPSPLAAPVMTAVCPERSNFEYSQHTSRQCLCSAAEPDPWCFFAERRERSGIGIISAEVVCAASVEKREVFLRRLTSLSIRPSLVLF